MTTIPTGILAPDATTYEKTLFRDLSQEITLDIRQSFNPLTADVSILPFLAINESVDLWYDDWTDERKRQMIVEALELSSLKGTYDGSVRYLGYVDGTIVDSISYPKRFVFGHGVIGRTPIGHMPFLARYLVKIETQRPPRAFVMGRAVLGRSRIKTHSRERLLRGLAALRIAKAPESEYRVDFAHKRLARIGDGIHLDDNYQLDQFLDRTRL
jgi:P2-related tail formation protein